MKKLKFVKTIIVLIFVLSFFSVFTACSQNSFTDTASSEGGDMPLSDISKSVDGLLGSIESGGAGLSRSGLVGKLEDDPTDNDDEVKGHLAPGQITAGEWNDLRNRDQWLKLFTPNELQEPGVFSEYLDAFNLSTLKMYSVSVLNASDAPINDALVTLKDDTGRAIFLARTDASGKAYLFPQANSAVSISITCGQETKSITITENVYEYSVKFSDVLSSVTKRLELMFVVDTTGSMSDELEYLKAEIDDVIKKVANLTGYDISLALLFYRDRGDEYVTRYFDFSTDISSHSLNLSQQNATGGGDTPEAVDIALSEAVNKQWSVGGGATRLIFHLLDAPPHSDAQNIELYNTALLSAAEKGIRIIPIASSGVDKLTEYLLRTEAQVTGGTYVFLTNDSGIGNSHIEPTVGDFIVEYLNELMIRLIKDFCDGSITEPIYYGDSQQ